MVCATGSSEKPRARMRSLDLAVMATGGRMLPDFSPAGEKVTTPAELPKYSWPPLRLRNATPCRNSLPRRPFWLSNWRELPVR